MVQNKVNAGIMFFCLPPLGNGYIFEDCIATGCKLKQIRVNTDKQLVFLLFKHCEGTVCDD